MPGCAHRMDLVSVLSRCAPTIAFLMLPCAAQPATLDDAFAAMNKTAQQFRGVTADLQRDVYTAVVDDHSIDSGVIRVKRDKSHDTRMLIEFTSPATKFVALDGGTASVYTPKTKTVQEVEVKKGLIEQFLLLGFGATSADLKEHYDVQLLGVETVGGQPAWHLQLIPKSPDILKNLKKAELWIGHTSGLPVQEKLYTSAKGDYELVTYTRMKLNPPLSDGDLKLKLPKGVTVEHPRL